MISVATLLKAGMTSPIEALAWGFIMIILMTLVVLFVTLTGLKQSVLRSIATFLAWSVAIIFVIAAGYLSVSAFANWPSSFAATVENLVHATHRAITKQSKSAFEASPADPGGIAAASGTEPVIGSQAVRVGDFLVNKVHCDRISASEVYCYLTATNIGTDNLDLAIVASPRGSGGSYLKFNDGTRFPAKASELGLDKGRGFPYTTDRVLAKDDIVATLKFDISAAKPRSISELVTIWGLKSHNSFMPTLYSDPGVFHNIPITEK
jgi:hypothetical protein